MRYFLSVSIFALLLIIGIKGFEYNKASELPYFEGDTDIDWASGYMTANKDKNGQLFYWLFPSLNSPQVDPLVIWLNGGPGCSSMFGALLEHGPLTVTPNVTLINNHFGWNSKATMMYVDQPVGVGYSYADDESSYVTNEEEVGRDFLAALLDFYTTDLGKQFRRLPLYITGESYAGKYVPAIAHAIIQHNKLDSLNSDDETDSLFTRIELEGIAIGNGWTDPVIQNLAYPEYFFYNGIIDTTQRAEIEDVFGECMDELKKEEPDLEIVADICEEVYNRTVTLGAVPDAYDIRATKDVPQPELGLYMNDTAVQKVLGVPYKMNWRSCDGTVGHKLSKEIHLSTDVKPWMPEIIDKIRVLFYTGVSDGVCSVNGIEKWLRRLDWSGAASWRSARAHPWKKRDELAGWVKSIGHLTQLNCLGGGHFWPGQQRENAQIMIETFLEDGDFCSGPDCGYSACPNACSSHGTCGPSTWDDSILECECEDDWSGPACDKIQVPKSGFIELNGRLEEGAWNFVEVTNVFSDGLLEDITITLTRTSSLGDPDAFVGLISFPDSDNIYHTSITSKLESDSTHVLLQDKSKSSLYISIHNTDYRRSTEYTIQVGIRAQASPVVVMVTILAGFTVLIGLMYTCLKTDQNNSNDDSSKQSNYSNLHPNLNNSSGSPTGLANNKPAHDQSTPLIERSGTTNESW